MKNTKRNKKGFSLLETMVALAVLLMAISGPLTLGFTSIKAASLAKNNLIAANLAQEGLELVKAYKMNNVLEFGKAGWLAGFSDASCFSLEGCRIRLGDESDLAYLNVESCAPSCVMVLNDNLYTHDNGTPSIFSRKINMTTAGLDPDAEVKVTVTVLWNERFGDQKFEINYYMQNW